MTIPAEPEMTPVPVNGFVFQNSDCLAAAPQPVKKRYIISSTSSLFMTIPIPLFTFFISHKEIWGTNLRCYSPWVRQNVKNGAEAGT